MGAHWPFLSDPGRKVQKDLDIAEYTDPHHDPMVPHTLVLEPGLVVHKIYNGYWFFGRPTIEELRHDLRAVTRRSGPTGTCRPRACASAGTPATRPSSTPTARPTRRSSPSRTDRSARSMALAALLHPGHDLPAFARDAPRRVGEVAGDAVDHLAQLPAPRP